VVYKISIVIPGIEHGGAIINTTEMPKVGDRLKVGDLEVEVIEIMDLLPPRGDFHFMHATCKTVEKGK
jgi:hypothetical protein